MLGLGLGLGLSIAGAVTRIGGFISKITFIAAYKGETDVQNVVTDGNVCNLMPKGTVTATSIHSTPILAKDADGVYQKYPVDEPVWKGGRVLLSGGVVSSVVETYSTDSGGQPIVPNPYLQANEAATNELLHSSDFLGAIWTLQVADVSNNTQLAPDGTNTATLMASAGAFASTPTVFQLVATTIPTKITWSFFAKAGTAGWVALGTYDGTTDVRQYFDLVNGVIGSSENGTFDRISMEPFVDGWYRCSVTRDVTVGTDIRIQAAQASADLIPTPGTDDLDLLIWGFQVQLGQDLGPYVPTTTAPASIPEAHYTFPTANIDPSDMDLSMRMDLQAAKELLNINGLTLTYGLIGDGNELIPEGDFFYDRTESNPLEFIASPSGVNHSSKVEFTYDTTYVFSYKVYSISSGGTKGQMIGEVLSDHPTIVIAPAHATGLVRQETGIHRQVQVRAVGTTTAAFGELSMQLPTKGLILSDGTNSVGVPANTGVRDIRIIADGSVMQLIVDGVESLESVYNPPLAGLITLKETAWKLAVQPTGV